MHQRCAFPLASLYRSALGYSDIRAGLPANVALDADVCGNAVGFGRDVLMATLGEFLERLHFHEEVSCDRHLSLAQYADRALAASVRLALIQTSDASAAELDGAAIAHTSCRRLSGGEAALLPRCLVSLQAEPDGFASKLVLIRDSSGCALHRRADASKRAAMCEFLERQCLVASWIAGRVQSRITGDWWELAVDARLFAPLAQMCRAGEVVVLLLSSCFPGYPVFCFFTASRSAAEVKFACGCAYDLDPLRALTRALMELWHCWIGLPFKLREETVQARAGSRLDANLTAYNCADAPQKLRFYRDGSPPQVPRTQAICQFVNSPKVEIPAVLQALDMISPNVFWYAQPVAFGNALFVASRIFSPDFFLHIDTSRRLNFDNRFAQYVGLSYGDFDFSPSCFA